VIAVLLVMVLLLCCCRCKLGVLLLGAPDVDWMFVPDAHAAAVPLLLLLLLQLKCKKATGLCTALWNRPNGTPCEPKNPEIVWLAAHQVL
jgi:hypothetical protein